MWDGAFVRFATSKDVSTRQIQSDLRSRDSRRTYPKKLKGFFNTVPLSSSLEEQAERFVQMTKENGGAYWVQETIFGYIAKEKEGVDDWKLAVGTLRTSFYTVKLFCKMNEDDLGTEGIKWRRLSRGLPPSKSYANDRAVPI